MIPVTSTGSKLQQNVTSASVILRTPDAKHLLHICSSQSFCIRLDIILFQQAVTFCINQIHFRYSSQPALELFNVSYRSLVLLQSMPTNYKRGTVSTTKFNSIDVIMGPMVSQIASLTIVYSTVYSSADQRKHQSSASLAFVRGIRRWPVNSPHKWPVTRK